MAAIAVARTSRLTWAQASAPVLLEIEPMSLPDTILRFWKRYSQFHAVQRELSGFSDRELADLGIMRADIPRVALEDALLRSEPPAGNELSAPPAGWPAPALMPGR